MQRTIRKAIKAMVWTLLAVQLAVTGILITGTLTSHQVMIVTGGSMEPTYPLGSAVVLDVSDRTPAVGDVITFYSTNKIITTHRVISLHDRAGGLYLRTKGDANPGPDHDLVNVNDVMGRPGLSIPRMGYAIDFLTSPVGKLITFGPALVMIATREARSLIAFRRGKISRREQVALGAAV
jgi:signal peptidase